jgi:hypothetical protein
MRHLCDLPCLLAKQVLSQLSYTPIPLFLFILNQLRILAPLETAQTVPLCQIRRQMVFSTRALVVPILAAFLASSEISPVNNS